MNEGAEGAGGVSEEEGGLGEGAEVEEDEGIAAAEDRRDGEDQWVRRSGWRQDLNMTEVWTAERGTSERRQETSDRRR